MRLRIPVKPLALHDETTFLRRDAVDSRAGKGLDAEAFWDETLGTFVLALDGTKHPCRVRSSNAGHALWTGIAEPGQARRAAASPASAAPVALRRAPYGLVAALVLVRFADEWTTFFPAGAR